MDDRLSQPHLVLIQWTTGLELRTLRSQASHPIHEANTYVWLSTYSFHLLSVSRLECHKAWFWGQFESESSSMIYLTLENPLYIFTDDPTLCRNIPHPLDRQVWQSHNLLIHLEYVSLSWCVCVCVCACACVYMYIHSLANPHIYFLNNLLEEVQSLKLLGVTISCDLSWANHISKFASKGSCQMASFVIQSPSLAHLNTYPAAIPSSAA